MYLQYAVTDNGELAYIDQASRGKTGLHCPYCGGLLTAKKGQVKAPHFAHTGVTCRPADRDIDLSLPAYDNFNLHLPGKVIAALRSFDQNEYSGAEADLLVRYELAEFNSWAGGYELTKLGKIPIGRLSLPLFSQIQEPLILTRHNELEDQARAVYQRPGLLAEQTELTARFEDKSLTIAERSRAFSRLNEVRYALRDIEGQDLNTALADLRIYRAQWQRILGLSLYFLAINGGQYHKIGVTMRPIAERLAEIRSDLTPLLGGGVDVQVIGRWPARGNAELYFKHRFERQRAQLGNLTEYFQFEDPKPVINELRRLKGKELTDLERAILAGLPADIEAQIQRDQQAAQLKADQDAIEAKRRVNIRQGMTRAKNRGKHIGRASLSDSEFLAHYPEVIEALASGQSLRKTAELTGVAVNTVVKVKSLIDKARTGGSAM